MANNVSFLMGTQSALNNLIANKTNIVPGAFYVTEDSHRMYFGASATEIVALNQGVITVDKVADLNTIAAEPGQFYYAAAENVLCVKSKSATGAESWVQINPDSNTKITSFNTEVSAADNVATVQSSIVDSDGNSHGTNSAAFAIKGNNITITKAADGKIIELSVPKYTVSADSTIAGKINLNANGAADSYITLTSQGGTVTISNESNGKVINLEAAQGNRVDTFTSTHQMQTENPNAANAVISLKQTSDTDAKVAAVTIEGGNGVSVSTPTTGAIKLDIDTFDLATEESSGDNKADIVLTQKHGTNEAIDAGRISIAGAGGNTVTQENDVITITAKDRHVDTFVAGNGLESGFQFTIQQTDFDTIEAGTEVTAIDPIISYGDGETKKTAKFVGGTAALDVYSKEDVNKKIEAQLQSYDAMRFKGILSSKAEFEALTDVSSGDTWKITSETDFELAGQQIVHFGDLIIASGTENEDGVIVSPTWNIVPAGDDIDTYIAQAIEKGFVIQRKTSSAENETLLAVTFEGDDAIGVTGSATSGNSNKISIKHKTITANDPAAETETQVAKSPITVTAVNGVTRDEFGHVTQVTTKEYTIVDTHNALENIQASTVNVTGENPNGVIVGTSVRMSDDTEAKADSFTLSAGDSKSLKVSAGSKTVNISLEWGTF